MSTASNADEYTEGVDNYVRTSAQAVGGTLGGTGGAIAGGMLGTAVGGIGAFIGAPVGGVGGAVAGGVAGGEIYDATLSAGVKEVARDYYTDHLTAYDPHQALRDKLNENY